MSEVRPADTADAARWLLESGVDWWDLVRYGPPGFDVYLRIALAQDVEAARASGDAPSLRLALSVLAARTTTPSSGYAAVWEGWTSRGPAPAAPRVNIPERAMLLFTGPSKLLRDAPSLAWYGP